MIEVIRGSSETNRTYFSGCHQNVWLIFMTISGEVEKKVAELKGEKNTGTKETNKL